MKIIAALLLALFAIPAAAQSPQERDRAAILAMAGTYKVKFDFRETVPFVADYKPIPDKVSGGYEVVRAIIDQPGYVALQHILVVTMPDKKTMLVKHWRQDWTYEPRTVLTYTISGRWTLTPVSDADRQGAWSQTVWQTDDSPRYGGVGRWRHDNGATRWMSNETLRPLARRDAIRKPPYSFYAGTNRHALTPNGWVHEQDNAKIGMKDGKPVTFVHETVINTYTPSTDFAVAEADKYWAATKDYWAAVRAEWDRIIEAKRGVTVTEEPDNGSTTGHELMLIADDIVKGEQKTPEAIAEARALIGRETSKEPVRSAMR